MKLKELTEEMAEALGMAEAEVYSYARALREKELLTTGPRGPGAPDMTPDDFLNLLIAICGSTVAKDAAAVLHKRRAFLAAECISVTAGRDAPDFAPSKGEALIAALARLLDAAADGTLGDWFRLPDPGERDLKVLAKVPSRAFEVLFLRAMYAVQIVALRMRREESGHWPEAGGIWHFAVPLERAGETTRHKSDKLADEDMISVGRLDLETFVDVAAVWQRVKATE